MSISGTGRESTEDLAGLLTKSIKMVKRQKQVARRAKMTVGKLKNILKNYSKKMEVRVHAQIAQTGTVHGEVNSLTFVSVVKNYDKEGKREEVYLVLG